MESVCCVDLCGFSSSKERITMKDGLLDISVVSVCFIFGILKQCDGGSCGSLFATSTSERA